MSFSKKGINQVALAKKATLLSVPTNLIVLGIRPAGKLTQTPYMPVKDYKDRTDPKGKKNFKFSGKTYQPNLKALSDIVSVYLADGGCDAEFLAVPQSSGVDGGCFQFCGASNYMSVDFKYLASSKERSVGLDLEVALAHSAANTLVDAADSNTPATTGLSNYGEDSTKRRVAGNINFTDANFSIDEMLSYEFLLSAEGERSELTNRFIIDYIVASLEFKFKAATIPNWLAVLGRDALPAITFQEDTGTSTYEKFSFAAGVLALNADPVVIGDDERTITLKYQGKFTPGAMSFDFTLLTGGGGASEDGTEGGTVLITV